MFRRFVLKWSEQYPKAVECLQKDIEDLCTFFTIPDNSRWQHISTTYAFEQRFVEVRLRTLLDEYFKIEPVLRRILYAIFIYANAKAWTPKTLLADQSFYEKKPTALSDDVLFILNDHQIKNRRT